MNPPILTATRNPDGSVQLTWTDVGAEIYEVERDGLLIVSQAGLVYLDSAAPIGQIGYRVIAHMYEQASATVTVPAIPIVTPPPTSGDGTSTAGDPWGKALMPVRPGMRVGGYTDFTEDGDRALGQGFGPHLSTVWRPRPTAAQDGTYKDSSQRGTYSVKDTYSQHGGIADIWLHAHNAGNPLVHVPTGSILKVFAALDQQNDQSESFVQWTMKCPVTNWTKQAPLFWAFGTNANGEDDMYEHKHGTGPRSNAFHHLIGGGQESIKLNVVTTDAHVLGMYRRRKGHRGASDLGEVSGYVDGVLRKTFTNKCSPNPMHFVLQLESYLKADPLPASKTDGHVLLTKYRLDVPA